MAPLCTLHLQTHNEYQQSANRTHETRPSLPSVGALDTLDSTIVKQEKGVMTRPAKCMLPKLTAVDVCSCYVEQCKEHAGTVYSNQYNLSRALCKSKLGTPQAKQANLCKPTTNDPDQLAEL